MSVHGGCIDAQRVVSPDACDAGFRATRRTVSVPEVNKLQRETEVEFTHLSNDVLEVVTLLS